MEKTISDTASNEEIRKRRYKEALQSMEQCEAFREDDRFIREYCRSVREQRKENHAYGKQI